jgi:pimeloyl-ACP methyl ester carboxylesterase
MGHKGEIVRIPLGDTALHGNLQIPPAAQGLVIFVHGSGSSRFSPRNMHVAAELNQHGLATLLLDLLTGDEQKIDTETMEFRFDIPLLAARSTTAAKWALAQPETSNLPIGLFGASTGSAAALVTASVLQDDIAAVVSRGGRPDLAEEALEEVASPTLLIVGGEDKTVLVLNRQALPRIPALCQLYVVPGATHLFEETGALEEVTRESAAWFEKYLQAAGARRTIVA